MPTIMPKTAKSLLLIEDEPADARTVRKFLQKAGDNTWQTIEAERLQDALEIYQHKQHITKTNTPFDVILLDLQLPDTSGLKTLKTLQQYTASTPIVVLTGSCSETLAPQLLATGAQDYLLKDDITPNQLLRSLHQAMERQSQLNHYQTQNQQLQIGLAQAQASSLLSSRLLNHLSYRIRTPLSVINALLNCLQNELESTSNDRIQSDLNRLQLAANQILGITEETCFLEQIQSSNFRPNPQVFDVAQACRSILTLSQHSAGCYHQLHFNCNRPYLHLTYDLEVIRCLLNSLLLNAIKYSPKGSRIILTLTSSETHIILEVQDHGIGIPAAEIPSVFETFYRASNAKGRHYGLGLGLAIAKTCVEIHHGQIQIDSQLNQGTTVTVTLPQVINWTPDSP